MDRGERVAAVVAVGLFVALSALGWLRELVAGPASSVGWEEAWNARGALMVACGHVEALGTLQYRPFCGGCTGEALLGAPLLAVLGPTRTAWRLVPLGFSALLVGAGLVALGRDRQRVAGAAWLLLALGAPGWVRAQAMTGWGNHAEGTSLALLGLALVARSLPGRRTGLALGGALVGLSMWWSWSCAWAAPVLLALVAAARSPRGLVALAAAPVGLAPLAVRLRAFPDERDAAGAFWSTLELAPPEALLRWLWTDLVGGGLWQTAASGGVDPGSAVFWATLCGLGAWGAVLGWRRGGGGRLVAPALLALVAAWALRHDAWDDNPAVHGFDWFNLRYRYALWPLLALGAAEAARRRPAALAAVVPLVAFSLGHRLHETGRPGGPAVAPAVEVGHSPDPTVPSGQPPRRLATQLTRPQDVAAAAAFLNGHRDRLPACRDHHAWELGRRVGLGGARPADAARARDALATDRDRAAFAEGLEAGRSQRPAGPAVQ